MSIRRALSRPVKVLIVDQNDESAGRLAQILATHAGHDQFVVCRSDSATGALTILTSQHPDLILVSLADTKAAHTAGQMLCRAVRSSDGQRHTGIIIMATAQADVTELSVECLEMGADDFVVNSCTAAELMARIKAVLRLKAMTDELRSANHKLKVLSLTDELTGLANMRCFSQRYGEMIRACRKGVHGLGVIMLDLDHFKSVNDTTNHLVGSFVIGEVGRLIQQKGVLDAGDVPARYGGDEFIIALPATALESVAAKAEVIRQMVSAAEFRRDGCVIHITASLGLAWTEPQFAGRAEDLIKAADLMLYRSKSLGRDRVSSLHLKYPVDLEAVSRTHLHQEKPVNIATRAVRKIY